MTPGPGARSPDELQTAARTMRRVRWATAGFAAVHLSVFDPVPGGDLPVHPVVMAFVVPAALVAINLASIHGNRSQDAPSLHRTAVFEVVADSLVIAILVALLSVEPRGSGWALAVIAALEAAHRLGLAAALWAGGGLGAVHVASEVLMATGQGTKVLVGDLVYHLAIILVVAVVAGLLGDELSRQLAHARRARADADERATLLHIAAEAGRSMAAADAGTVLDAVVAGGVELGFDTALVSLADADARRWRSERWRGVEVVVDPAVRDIDAGVAGAVRRERRTVVVEDYRDWPDAIDALRDAGFATVVGVPVFAGGDVAAVLNVATRRARPVTPAEIECLELLAANASAALESSRRSRESQGLEARLVHQARHDRLTGIPNRAWLFECLAAELAGGRPVAVLVCDLDRFKTVNDSLGHTTGDRLLVALTERIADVVGDAGSVARLGGDELAIVLPGADPGEALALGERVVMQSRRPVALDGVEVVLSLSVGVAVGADVDPVALVRDAELAMYRAKQTGRGRCELFSVSMRDLASRRLETEVALRRAVDEGAIEVAYQPMLSLVTGELEAVEALARWTHPERGPIPPDEFIPMAEEMGIIGALGRHVLETACRQARSWQLAGAVPVPRVSVNLSVVQLVDGGCAQAVAEVLDETGLDPALLTLEITESVVMDDSPELLATLYELAGLGVRLSVDDFGKGWSSLAYLTRYPLHELKVDRTFVSGVSERSADRAVVRALVVLAHELGLSVVAEGIELDEQRRELTRLGCDMGQGYLLHRPGPAEQISRVVLPAAVR